MSAPEPQDDVQEFAALLRRLKEGTDRSYGSLARRLGMNTSTLHRYCAGDAVPVDFAPAERFAALCGASAEERMDLHRLWLSAVAARQRPRTAESSETSESSESTAALVVPAGAGPTEVAGGPRADAACEPGPESAFEGPDDSESAGEPDTVRVTGSAPPPRPWYRRRRFLVTAAAVVVALATLGSLSALPSGRPASDKVAQAPDPSSRTTASGLPDRSGSPSPRPSATSASPRPRPPERGPPPRRPTAAAPRRRARGPDSRGPPSARP